jgi:hypothetical protein
MSAQKKHESNNKRMTCLCVGGSGRGSASHKSASFYLNVVRLIIGWYIIEFNGWLAG